MRDQSTQIAFGSIEIGPANEVLVFGAIDDIMLHDLRTGELLG